MDDRRKNYRFLAPGKRAWSLRLCRTQSGAAKGTFLIALVNCTIQANGLSAD